MTSFESRSLSSIRVRWRMPSTGDFRFSSRAGIGWPSIGDGLLQRSTDGGHAVDAAVRVVAVGIAHVVLHVADDDVVPVAEIQRAVGREDGIRRAEVLVAAHQQAARFVLGLACRRR